MPASSPNNLHTKIQTYCAVIGLFLTLIGLIFTYLSFKNTLLPNKEREQYLQINKSTNRLVASTAFILASVSITIYVVLKKKKKNRRPNKRTDFAAGTKFSWRTQDLMKNLLADQNITLWPLNFTEFTTINDAVFLSSQVYNLNKPFKDIEKSVRIARKQAYTFKYADPKEDEDEKLVAKESQGEWETHLFKILHRLKISNLQNLRVLDVGIGNGMTYSNQFLKIENFRGVDLSKKALNFAVQKFPNLTPVESEAENLMEIETNSVDLYLSFRCFQSTLFNRRDAIREARRVLVVGGHIVISIPILIYHKDDKSFEQGLYDSNHNCTMDYAYDVVIHIIRLLETLGFSKININDSSPFEIFIYATAV